MSGEICLSKLSFAYPDDLSIYSGQGDIRVSGNEKNLFQTLFEMAIAKDLPILAEEDDTENKNADRDIPISSTVISMAASVQINPDMAASVAPNPVMAEPVVPNLDMAASTVTMQDMEIRDKNVDNVDMVPQDAATQGMEIQDAKIVAPFDMQGQGIAQYDMSILGTPVINTTSPGITVPVSDSDAMNSNLVFDKVNEALSNGSRLTENERKLENSTSEASDSNPMQMPMFPMNALKGEEKVYFSSSKNIEPYGQIAEEIQFNLEKKGPMEFRMQLEPKNLGEIDVKLRIKEGKLIIDIIASDPKTQGLLSGQVDKLVMNMGLRNVLVEKIQIDNLADMQQGDKADQGIFTNEEMGYSSGKQHGHSRQHWESDYNIEIPNFKTGTEETNILDMHQHGTINGANLVKMDYTI